MSPNCDVTWGPDQTDGSCKAKNIAGATVVGQLWVPNCKLPLCLQLQTDAMEASLSWNIHSPVPGKVSPSLKELSMGRHTPTFCLPAVRGGHPGSQALQEHPTRGAPCSGARPGKRGLILLFPESLLVFTGHLLEPSRKDTEWSLAYPPNDPGTISTQSLPLLTLAPTE